MQLFMKARDVPKLWAVVTAQVGQARVLISSSGGGHLGDPLASFRALEGAGTGEGAGQGYGWRRTDALIEC